MREPAKPKTAPAEAVAFISNCGPAKRLKLLDQLQGFIKVDSFGKCKRSAQLQGDSQW